MRKILAILGIASLAVLSACETTTTEEGAAVGGLLGAGAGAVIGHQSGHAIEGGLLGAGAGAVTGAVIGHQNEHD